MNKQEQEIKEIVKYHKENKRLPNLIWRDELEELLFKYSQEEIESTEIVLFVYRLTNLVSKM